MQRGVWVAALAFGVTLAVIVGVRLPDGGLAVAVGVGCGIAAGLPVSGALLYLLWRERQERRRLEERAWRGEERLSPPVFILNAGRGVEALPGTFLNGLGGAPPRTREFTIVGEEEESQRSS